jgi:hypothetical protein
VADDLKAAWDAFEAVLTDAINRHAIEHLAKRQFSYRAFDGVRAAARALVKAARADGHAWNCQQRGRDNQPFSGDCENPACLAWRAGGDA